MKDKKQNVNYLKEWQKVINEFRNSIEDIGNKLAKLLHDIEIPDEEEDIWEMKCPYENNDDIYTLSNDGEVKKTTGHISIMTENVLSKVTSSQPKKQQN